MEGNMQVAVGGVNSITNEFVEQGLLDVIDKNLLEFYYNDRGLRIAGSLIKYSDGREIMTYPIKYDGKRYAVDEDDYNRLKDFKDN